MSDTTKWLYVSSLGEVEIEGYDLPYEPIGGLAEMRSTHPETAPPMVEDDWQFVKWVWAAQDILNDGRFNVRGVWPHILLDTEFLYPGNKPGVKEKLATLATKLGACVEDMDSPQPPDELQVSLTKKFEVSTNTSEVDYAALLKEMAKQKAVIKRQTQKLWDLYGMSVS